MTPGNDQSASVTATRHGVPESRCTSGDDTCVCVWLNGGHLVARPGRRKDRNGQRSSPACATVFSRAMRRALAKRAWPCWRLSCHRPKHENAIHNAVAVGESSSRCGDAYGRSRNIEIERTATSRVAIDNGRASVLGLIGSHDDDKMKIIRSHRSCHGSVLAVFGCGCKGLIRSTQTPGRNGTHTIATRAEFAKPVDGVQRNTPVGGRKAVHTVHTGSQDEKCANNVGRDVSGHGASIHA